MRRLVGKPAQAAAAAGVGQGALGAWLALAVRAALAARRDRVASAESLRQEARVAAAVAKRVKGERAGRAVSAVPAEQATLRRTRR